MENNTLQQQNLDKEEDVQFIPLLRTCYHIFIEKWKWFAFSAIICLVLGFIYLQRQPRIFLRQSVMLIEDAETGQFPSSSRKSRGNMSSLLELNGISVGDNLKNEIFILTSNRLMERVVDSLHLTVNYSTDESLHKVDLYKNTPLQVTFGQEKIKFPVNFEISILDENTFRISDMKANKEDYDEEWTVKAGETVNTPAGPISITANKKIKKFLEDHHTVYVTRLSKAATTAVYHSKLNASEYDKESSLIVLSCNDMNPARAEDVLNEIFNAYKRDVVENKNRVAQSTMSFIDDRISLIGNELGSIENSLATFKKSNKIIDFKQTAQVFANESSTARKQTIEMETRLQVAKYLQSFLSNHSHSKEVIPMLNLEGATFTQQLAEYNKLMMERNNFAANTSENSVAIIERDRQLTSLRSSIEASLKSYVNTIELQVKEARNNEDLLNSKVSSAPSQEKEALSIERQQNLKAALYNYLLNKREEVAMQLAINEANVRLVEYPMGSPSPVSPRNVLILLISFILGILIPASILWIRTLFDTTVTGRKDVEENTSIPVAGEIPTWKEFSKATKTPMITSCKNDAPIVEAFRVLRYGLMFMRHNAKVFVTTSTTPGQGKSFISSNLAVILSMSNKKVLLIDADIRKRTISLEYEHHDGLTSYLADEEDTTDLKELIVENAIYEGVDFLPAGITPPNPAELLMSDRFEQLIERAKEYYDYVIIDTTPFFSVADASIVARVADLTLYIIRAGVQEREFLTEMEKMYQNKQLHNLCIVLNDTNPESSHSGYGYGYGYGYGRKKDENSKFIKKPKFLKKK